MVRELFGIQAQDIQACNLAVWNRLQGSDHSKRLSPSKIQQWFTSDAGDVGLIRCHGQRGTLHIYDVQTWPVVCALVQGRLLNYCERFASSEVAEVLFQKLSKHLEAGHAVSTDDFEGAEFGTRYRTLMRLTLGGYGTRVEHHGKAVLAPRSRVAPDLTAWPQVDAEDASVVAAERYFSAFGPASEQDFRYYMGIRAGVSKVAVEQLRAEGKLVPLEVVRHGNSIRFPHPLFVWHERALELEAMTAASRSPAELPALLLGRFDVLLLGHADKSWLIDDASKSLVWSKNADVRAVVLLHGRIQGTWQYKWEKKGALKIEVDLFRSAKPSKQDLGEIRARAQDLADQFFEAAQYSYALSKRNS